MKLRAVLLAMAALAVAGASAAVPFTLPFDTTAYASGPLEAVSDDETTGAAIYWEVDEGAAKIRFGLAANVNGFVGFGMNTNQPGMPGADVVVCRLTSQGEIEAVDMHAPRFDVPVADVVNDVTTLSAGRADGVTWCEFERPLRTCDATAQADVQITDLELTLYGLLAWHEGDSLTYHGADQRRTQPFTFAQAASVSLPPDAVTFTLTAPDAAVSTESGSYACSYHVLPVDAAERFHVVHYRLLRSGPAVDAGVLHHVNGMACSSPIGGLNDGDLVNCDLVMGLCSETLLNDGYSGAGTSLPAHAGIPIGNGATQYMIISRHMYNPAAKTGVVDTGTAYEITYTPTLRPNELRQIAFARINFTIPAMTYGHTVTNFCSSDCSADRLGRVTVNAVTFHMHGHGVRASMRVVRDGVEQQPLAVAEPFDASQFSFQVNRVIEPGDALILECVYDNDLPVALSYGDALDEEMCVAFLSVVGAPNMTQCVDLADGLDWSTLPPSCIGYEHTVPACNFNLSRSYCPDTSDAAAPLTFITEDERAAPYDVWVEPDDDCLADEDVTLEEIPAVAGACRADGEAIVGAVDLPFGPSEFSLAWTTDCTASEVAFEASVFLGGTGWFAVGLHDAGNASHPVPLPATRMLNADIVQMSVSQGAIADRVGPAGYSVPVDKTTAVAALVEAEVVAGKSRVVFTRPFSSPEGVTLVEDRFVWIIASVRTVSDDFDAKHDIAGYLTTRVSLFDGRAEATRVIYPADTTADPSVTTTTTTTTTTAVPATTDGPGSTEDPVVAAGTALVSVGGTAVIALIACCVAFASLS